MASRLPEEMIINILSFLPVKSISRFRCVCKAWYELLKSPDFIQMHLNLSKENDHFNFMLSHGKEMYSIHYDGSPLKDLCDKAIQIHHPFKFLGPDDGIVAFCDGLFCLGSYRSFETFICLWNPYTGEYKEIMVPPIEFQHPQTTTGVNQESNSVCRSSYGFGYDCNIKDYKLVRIVNLNAYGSEVKVYALGSNSWRLIGNIPYNISYQEPRGILVNGTLHWSACKLPAQLHSIISFHIESERFEEVPLPQVENFDYKHQISLCVSGGCLCILTHHHKVRTEIWVMKEYGVRDSWAKLVSITQQTILDSFYLMPILFYKNGVILLDQNYHSCLVSYDPEHDSDVINFDLQMLRITPYVGSLVSPNSGTFVSREKSEEVIEQNKMHRRIYKRRRL